MIKAMKATFGVLFALLIFFLGLSLFLADNDPEPETEKPKRINVTADTKLDNSQLLNYNIEVFDDGSLEEESYSINNDYIELDTLAHEKLRNYIYPYYKVKEILYTNVSFGKCDELDKGIFKLEGTLISEEYDVLDGGEVKKQPFILYFADKDFYDDDDNAQYIFLRIILDGEDITKYLDIDKFLNS